MIVVDTSVWVTGLRGGNRRLAGHLRNLLDGDSVALPIPVRIELLSGTSPADARRLRRALSSLPVFYPTGSTWGLIERWVEAASSSGDHFGFGDLLIAAIAAENGCPLWSLDSDFERMASRGWFLLHEFPEE